MGKTGHLISSLLTSYKRSAERRGVTFNLTRGEFLELILQDCYICGAAPSNIARKKHTHGVFHYTGIDRVDNTLGYIPGNVMPCCHKCNCVKSKMPLSELKEHLRKMLRGLKGVTL